MGILNKHKMYRKESIIDFLMWCVDNDKVSFLDSYDTPDINTTEDIIKKVASEFIETVEPLNKPKAIIGFCTNLQGMTTKDKYDYLIGLIEGCMECDNDVMATERLLDSLLIDLRTKYPVFSPVDSVVEFHSYDILPLNESPDKNQ